MKKLNKEMLGGLLIVGLFVLWGISWEVAKFVYRLKGQNLDAAQINLRSELVPPLTSSFILGTDNLGRSLFAVLSEGVVYSLSVAFLVTLASSFIGMVIGHLSVRTFSGFRMVLQFVIEAFFVVPGLVLAVLILSHFNAHIFTLIFTLVLINWAGHARVVRTEILRILSQLHIESALALGMSEIRLFLFHVFPLLLPQLLVLIVLSIGNVIISESILSFLGLGGSEFSWGSLFYMAKSTLLEAPYFIIILSLVMGLLIIGLNLLGDGLRDYLDPKYKD